MLKVKIHQKLLILWIKMLIENFFLVLDFWYLTNNFQNPKSDMFYHQKKEIFQNLMPNRCYFSTMALDLIFGPKCLLTQILEYHVFTKIFHCDPVLPFYFPPIHTQTISNMNSRQSKAKKRQYIQDYAFINIESRLYSLLLNFQFKAHFLDNPLP